MNYADLYNPQQTPQTERADERQVRNSAGGYVYGLDKWKRLERFLILGSDSNTYYQSARKLTRENAKVVEQCWADNPITTACMICDVSREGRAPKNDPAIFALALGAISQDAAARKFALHSVGTVCRTGTHLFQFVAMAKQLGKGFGRGMKRAVADWYDSKDVDKLAYQVIKYRQREGFTHENLLDLAHPAGGKGDMARNLLYKWIVGKIELPAALGGIQRIDDVAAIPDLITAHERAMKAETAIELVPLVEEHKLPWEAIPTWALNDPAVWKAMLPGLGMTALIRNLGNMTRIGAVMPMSVAESLIIDRLSSDDEIAKSRVHPMQILTALRVYASGRTLQHGLKISATWEPNQKIVGALDRAFYKAFKNVKPSGKRTLLALDISGSMSTAMIGGVLSSREASAAMSLVTMAIEPMTHVIGFSAETGGGYFGGRTKMIPLSISPEQRLDDAVRAISGLPFGGTNCALPMLYALEQGIEADVFAIYTDNETWAGNIHPVEALRKYREQTGIDAKLIVVGMTSTGFTIGDPKDPGCLDVVGFDASAPAVMADFARD